MEEVDGIIIHTLKAIGCDIEDDVRSIHQFSTELTVEATVRCLKNINNDLDLPNKLAPSMAVRFRVGTSLAKALQDLGYRGEVGYQTFLYSNEAELRRVFIFLVEKLPKDTSESQEEVLGASALLQRAIGQAIRKRLSAPWTPPFCKAQGVAWRGKPAEWYREGTSGMHRIETCPISFPHKQHDITARIPKVVREYYKNSLPFVHDQPPQHHQVAASLLEMNTRAVTTQQALEAEGLGSRASQQEYKSKKRQKIHQRMSQQIRQSLKEAAEARDRGEEFLRPLDALGGKAAPKTKGSRFTHAERLQFARDEEKAAGQIGVGDSAKADTEEELKKNREEEISQLKDDLAGISSRLEEVQLSIRKSKAGMQQSQEHAQVLEDKNREKKEAYKVKKKTMDLLPDADNNIAKLQDLVEASSQRLVKLASQWEKHRVPLVEKYRDLKQLSTAQQSEVDKLMAEIQELREMMKESAAEARTKDEHLKQLRADFENMTRDVNRSAYTKRILEIVSNIKKQKKQIDQVLLDTKSVQKEINQLTGKLDRTFTVTDELIFKDAKKDDAVRRAYKNLAALHQNCNSVIQTVEETGVILREIRDLEDQVEQESKKKVLDNLEKITADYQAIKKENASLMSKLNKQSES